MNADYAEHLKVLSQTGRAIRFGKAVAAGLAYVLFSDSFVLEKLQNKKRLPSILGSIDKPPSPSPTN
jgi:hypothetical protein